ncbi:Histidine-binding periplasmic protein precursor [Raoultella planticola]|uniref:Histidine-binding periplasmic protein n=1 Tax=Raoultella planticola TaxID=575 RepID=A0A485AAS0_RAOPL|nr:Histidine-binding periplasmic protein precursor [Raoultella planticola]
MKIVGYANQDNVYLDLLSGRIDASLQDNIQAATSFVDTPRGQKFAFAARSSATAASRLMSALRSIKTIRHCATPLNGAIKQIRADGTYAAIEKKYFSFDIYGN